MKDGEVYEVMESSFSRMQQRKAVVQAKLRKLATGKIVEIRFQPSDQFAEAEIDRKPLLFVYQHRGEYVFTDPADKKNRFSIASETIGENVKWLKPNIEVTAVFFSGKMLSIVFPIKMDFQVAEAPPGVQGDRATSGTKSVVLETGAAIQTPPFINAGDTIRVNTETGTYVERVEKAL